ncbi:MAG: YjjW family glycine radical enzyme activase [Eubacteriales bacterium]|nr:YjjW family glycine radical enzyme activase [Eubacteriales bacterium]
MARSFSERCAKAPVNKIIPFSSVDGPGNRTAVFLQGCNFDCRYCHNPETRRLCIACGDCVDRCPAKALRLQAGEVLFDPAKCCGCDTCIRTCTYDSSPRIRWMDAQETFAEVKKQMPYIRGVTVSGGECTLYPQFLKELFALCHDAGLSTLIDSNGTLDFRAHPELLAQTDGVMLDIKAWSREDHERVTGSDNELVLRNAVYLAERGQLTEVRTVIVPELFDTAGTVEETAKLLAPYRTRGEIRYKLITYRPMGVREQYAHSRVPQNEEMEKLRAIAITQGLKDVVIV